MAPRAKVEAKPESTVGLGPRPRLVCLIVKNFRCIGLDPVTIDLDDIVVLVGPNNTVSHSVSLFKGILDYMNTVKGLDN